MKIFAASLLFALWLSLITPLFSLLATAIFFLPPLRRYRIISGWSRLAVGGARLFCGIRYRVVGLENLPQKPCVILSRHESAWETIAYQVLLPPQVFVLKRELLRIPFFGWGLAQMSPVAINRGDKFWAMRQILRQGKRRLGDGFHIVVFPEGTRMAPRQFGKYQNGGARLAKFANTPVVPIAVNSGRCWRKNGFLKFPGLISVQIGPPIDGENLSTAEINKRAKQWIENALADN